MTGEEREQHTNQEKNISSDTSMQSVANEEEFLSLREIILMILKHRIRITAFVIILTVASGIFFLLQPRLYKAEGFLQVIPSIAPDGKVDNVRFETDVISHLERVKSPFIAKRVAQVLSQEGYKTDTLQLQKKVEISCPRKSDLIRVLAPALSAEQAVSIVRIWIEQYMDSIRENNITASLTKIRSLIQQAQTDAEKKQAAVETLKTWLGETSPLITLSKTVDDEQLWEEIAQSVKPSELKKLSEIHLKGEEQSDEYLIAKSALLRSEQELTSALADRKFYTEVERILERKTAKAEQKAPAEISKSQEPPSQADLYVERLIKSSNIVPFGESAVASAARGALKKTALVFVCSLLFACFYAFAAEWLRGFKISS